MNKTEKIIKDIFEETGLDFSLMKKEIHKTLKKKHNDNYNGNYILTEKEINNLLDNNSNTIKELEDEIK